MNVAYGWKPRVNSFLIEKIGQKLRDITNRFIAMTCANNFLLYTRPVLKTTAATLWAWQNTQQRSQKYYIQRTNLFQILDHRTPQVNVARTSRKECKWVCANIRMFIFVLNGSLVQGTTRHSLLHVPTTQSWSIIWNVIHRSGDESVNPRRHLMWQESAHWECWTHEIELQSRAVETPSQRHAPPEPVDNRKAKLTDILSLLPPRINMTSEARFWGSQEVAATC